MTLKTITLRLAYLTNTLISVYSTHLWAIWLGLKKKKSFCLKCSFYNLFPSSRPLSSRLPGWRVPSESWNNMWGRLWCRVAMERKKRFSAICAAGSAESTVKMSLKPLFWTNYEITQFENHHSHIFSDKWKVWGIVYPHKILSNYYKCDVPLLYQSLYEGLVLYQIWHG